MMKGNESLLDVKTFKGSTHPDSTRANGGGGFSLIYSNNGKRAVLNASFLDMLSHPTTVQFAYSDDVLAIGTYLDERNTNYTLRKSGKNGAIYNAALVKELIDQYELDFSERTSLTFPIMKTQELDNEVIVFINMKPEVELIDG
ncbi:hypothetical protein [Salipaludibacillus sp. CF4.18]|uniref:hypothetical protein n=1 Tax=Salipaludibacillus sp. CF4.18 TaxID=3373081 RepID=UPI003EE6EA62